MICAVVNENNSVIAVMELQEYQIQELSKIFPLVVDISHDNPTPKVGWVFDGSRIINPNPYKRITKLAFRQRFTVPEMIGIINAMNTNPVVRVLQENMNVATYVDLDRSDTIAGVQYLYSQGLLTLERMTAILTNPIQEYEEYKG